MCKCLLLCSERISFHNVCFIGKLIPHFAHWCELNQCITGGFDSLGMPLRYLRMPSLATSFWNSLRLFADAISSSHFLDDSCCCCCFCCFCCNSFSSMHRVCWRKILTGLLPFGSIV